MEFMTWATVSSWSCLCWLYDDDFTIFGCKEYNQSDLSVDHLVMSMCRVFSCVVGRGCLLWPVCSLRKTLLASAELHFALQGQACLLLQVPFDFPCILIPYDERKLSAEELMPLNCGVGEDSWESLALQGDPTSPFWRRSALGFLWKEWC